MKRYKYFPDARGAILLLVGIVVAQVLVLITLFDFGVNLSSGDPMLSITSVLANGIVFSMFMYFSGIKYGDLFHPSTNSVSSTLVLSLLPATAIVVGAFGWLGDFEMYLTSLLPADKDSLDSLTNMMDDGIISLITICIIAPFVEEMLFRGIILRGFLIHYTPTVAILLSSIFFGLIHLNIYQIPGAFILGCVLGCMFYYSRSLWPCIFSHSLNNLGAYIYYLENKEGYLSETGYEYNSVVINVVSLLVTLGGMYFFYKVFRYRPKA